MSKGSAPASPDPYTTAAAQYQYGTQAADYNAALGDTNTSGPTGSTSYKVTGTDPTTGAPIRTQTTTLSAPEQQILNQSQGVQSGQLDSAGNLLDAFNTASAAGAPNIAPVKYNVDGTPIQSNIDTSNVPGIENTQDAYTYGQSTALAGEQAAQEPALQQDRAALDSSLRNSGAQPGTPAYDNAMAKLDASQTATRAQMAGAAITAGQGLQNTQYGESANTNSQIFGQQQAKQTATNAAQGQDFSEKLSDATLSNTAGSTDLADWAQKTGIPLNELSAILGGSQVATPSAVAPTQASTAAPDIMSAFQNQYAGALSKYNAGVSTSNAEVGDAATLGTLAYLALA